MKNKNQLRVLLESDAHTFLEEMLKVLKENGNFVRITPSQLLSWIVTKFKDESFEKHKNQIIHEHFNSKEYLRDLATKIDTSDDASKLLESVLQKLQTRRKKINAKKNQKENVFKKNRSERI